MRSLRLLFPAALALLTGCGVATLPTTPLNTSSFSGSVHGGQQPVSGSTIQLYTVGTTGDRTNSTPLLIGTVTTDANGNFNITARYTCVNATQVYILATGGNPGLASANNNLALMTALGACTSLSPTTFISINELTTVAAVYALAPYIGNYQSIGAGSSDFSALTAAMTTAGQYVSTATGLAPGNAPPTGDTDPTTLINTIGDILATCINSTGGYAPSATPCGQLFTLTTIPGGTAPTNTVAAMLNLALDPTLNTSALYNLASPTAPFQPTLAAIPPDLNVRFTVPASQQALQISPSALTFPSTTVNFPSNSQSVTIMNSSPATVTITQIGLLGPNSNDFSSTNNCGASLLAGATCTAQVTFAPTAAGTRQGYLFINSSSPTSPQYVQLTGSGVTGAPHAVFSLPALAFTVGGTQRTVTLSNTGTAPLVITGFSTLTPYFPISSNCGGSVAANGSCTVTVLNQAPHSDGIFIVASNFVDQLTLVSNDPSANYGVNLSANNPIWLPSPAVFISKAPVGSAATASFLLIYTAGLADCNTLTGSSGITVTLPNAGSPVDGTGTQVFDECTYNVSYTPTAAGTFTGTITGFASASDPAFIPVTVFAVPASSSGPTLSSGSSPYTLTNSAFQPATISSITTSSLFSQTNTCGSSIAAQGTCTITTTYIGTQPGVTAGGLLTVNDSAGSATAALSGSLAPSMYTLDYGSSAIGTASTTSYTASVGGYGQRINAGVGLTATGDFTGGSSSGLGGASVTSTFVPTAAGTRTGTLAASIYYQGSFSANYLTTGVGLTSTSIAVPATLAFGDVLVGGYLSKTIAYGKTTATPSFANISITGPAAADFILTTPCTSACTLGFTFKPSAFGARTATISFTDTSTGTAYSVAASGIGTYNGPVASPSPIYFGATHLNVATTVALTVTNGGSPLTAASSGAPFSLDTSTCAATASTCTFNVTFTPTAQGGYNGTITITDAYFGKTATVNVSGTGGLANATFSAQSYSFPVTPVGSTTAAKSIVLSNTGDGAFTLNFPTLSGTNASEFSFATSCNANVPAGSSCNLYITFAPTTAGSKSASLAVTANGTTAGLPATLPITGSAQ